MMKRSSARERNRRSILDAASEVLRQDPEATLDDVAARAGVVRRTVYGHFANRQALLVALVHAAAADFVEQVGEVDTAAADPATELAAVVVRTWSTARRNGPLITLARQTVDAEVRAAMTPFHAVMARLIAHGQQSGVFARHVDAAILGEVLENGSATYLRAAESGRWDGDETDVAVGHLLTLGVPPEAARDAVARAVPAAGRRSRHGHPVPRGLG
ncbi:Transcriptional regulator, TetR family [Pseudonocardia sp. Ae168_Ps1]|nr:Transcriptional regulator, TetR family [Pseudonocardia sp. Ae150A_Ps1]OLL79088.1 Transcriptional regulator, TetR family [Pseudonocardia sp. Ae168_Ps1]OLL86774.1 Transcriptional regulator, TetR family [Pseudonocardia sp. Ae263_Ps1]OLL93182.1 Transcriptional regulator, TetR family [Pseudonocardia sp. Ae356_Ps1]